MNRSKWSAQRTLFLFALLTSVVSAGEGAPGEHELTARIRRAADRIEANYRRLATFRVEYGITGFNQVSQKQTELRTRVVCDRGRLRQETEQIDPVSGERQPVIRTIADGVRTEYHPLKRVAMRYRSDDQLAPWPPLHPAEWGSTMLPGRLVDRLRQDRVVSASVVRQPGGADRIRAELVCNAERSGRKDRPGRRYVVELDPGQNDLPVRLIVYKLANSAAQAKASLATVSDFEYQSSSGTAEPQETPALMLSRMTLKGFGGYPDRRITDPDSTKWDGRRVWTQSGKLDRNPAFDGTTFHLAFPEGTQVKDFTRTY